MPKLTVTIEWREHKAMDARNTFAVRAQIERVVRGDATNLATHIVNTMLPNGIVEAKAEVGDIEE